LLGDIGPAAAYLKQMIARLQAERPLTQEAFERFIGLTQRLPGLSVEAHVAAAPGPDGHTRLTLRVQRRAFDADVTLSDGNRNDLQALFKVSSNAHTRFAEQLTARFLLPPGDDSMHYQSLDYSQYLDAQGSQLLVSAARYRAEPGTRVRLKDGSDVTQRRESERYSIGLGQSLMIAPDEWVNVSGRLYSLSDHIEDRRAGQLEYDTYVRALSFEGDWRKADARRLRMVSAGVYQGLDYLGARSDADYDMDFLRFRVSALQSDQLFDSGQGVASAAFYWSDDRVPDSERAVFGGQHFGRGYPRDQAAGDKGWGVAYELNYSTRPSDGWLKLLQPYAVLDAAQAWYNGGPFEDAHMSSVALGLRLGDGRFGSVAVEVAKPLADVAMDSLNRGPRLMLTISYQLE
ncbi:MAG TPA: ShlB/FhaC/HecB family hemolysin secretion/activation protein, partial [Pseudomonas sp.]|nr:ShlB/FhaC/HecB family hemolysin secretion/activation protein [Pseudomonas sp.]